MHNSYFTHCSISRSNNKSNCYRKDIRLSMSNTNQLPLRKFPASNELTLLRLFLLKSVFHTIKCDVDYLSGNTTQFLPQKFHWYDRSDNIHCLSASKALTPLLSFLSVEKRLHTSKGDIDYLSTKTTQFPLRKFSLLDDSDNIHCLPASNELTLVCLFLSRSIYTH